MRKNREGKVRAEEERRKAEEEEERDRKIYRSLAMARYLDDTQGSRYDVF